MPFERGSRYQRFTGDPRRSSIAQSRIADRIDKFGDGPCALVLHCAHAAGKITCLSSRARFAFIGEPKKADSYGYVALPEKLESELRSWMREESIPPEGWLFPASRGSGPLRPNN